MADFNNAAYKSPVNPYTKGQCTWYAFGRIYELTSKKLSVSGNAGQWYDSAPSKKQFSYPSKKRVACWSGGNGDFGHVLVIEDVFDDGSMLFSEANYDGDGKLSSADGKILSVNSEDDLMKRFGRSYTFEGYIGV
ncbi:CHAP domain-containing protein [Marasmitruncus massiliensis]|uniref:CHAP domain-containing protein n=1 Tax=Marasmitruncus massiliensis TaxID=1944642 RepID=UPI0015E13A37|nr:CHAP domain-containing protein [Marasmitruncus massiliensis]